VELTRILLEIHVLATFDHKPLGQIGIAARFVDLGSRKPERIFTVEKISVLDSDMDVTDTINSPIGLNTRNNDSDVTLTSLGDTLIEEASRNGPAIGFLLDKIELEALRSVCQ